jgi:hypothetical protein
VQPDLDVGQGLVGWLVEAEDQLFRVEYADFGGGQQGPVVGGGGDGEFVGEESAGLGGEGDPGSRAVE